METVKSIQEKIKEVLVQIHSLKADKTKAQKMLCRAAVIF